MYRHQMFAQMTRQQLRKTDTAFQEPSGAKTQAGHAEEPGCSSSATSEGWEHVSVADDFSISVTNSEAKIYYDDKLVARAVLHRGDVELRLEPSLQGRRHFPMDGFMRTYKKAQELLTST